MAGKKGGAMPGAGRPPGSPNKTTVDIRILAQQYGPACIVKLAEMAGVAVDAQGRALAPAKTEAVRATAIKELMDRGFGKSTQFIATDEAADGLTVKVVRFTPLLVQEPE